MRAALRLVRIGNTFVSFAGTVVGGLAARGSGLGLSNFTWLDLLLAAGSTACVTAGGNVLNDLLDRESDRVNHPERPLVTGAISIRAAQWGAAAFLVAAVLLILPVVGAYPLVGILLTVALVALLSYEFRFKSVGFGGNLLVGFLTGAVFLYGGAAVGTPAPVLPLTLMAFFATLSREVIKDMEDVAGDTRRRTLPRVRGMPLSAATARAGIAVAITLSVVPLLRTLSIASVAGVMYGTLVAAADAVFVVSVLWLPHRLHREQTLSKAAMAIALVAFLSVAFR